MINALRLSGHSESQTPKENARIQGESQSHFHATTPTVHRLNKGAFSPTSLIAPSMLCGTQVYSSTVASGDRQHWQLEAHVGVRSP